MRYIENCAFMKMTKIGKKPGNTKLENRTHNTIFIWVHKTSRIQLEKTKNFIRNFIVCGIKRELNGFCSFGGSFALSHSFTHSLTFARHYNRCYSHVKDMAFQVASSLFIPPWSNRTVWTELRFYTINIRISHKLYLQELRWNHLLNWSTSCAAHKAATFDIEEPWARIKRFMYKPCEYFCQFTLCLATLTPERG